MRKVLRQARRDLAPSQQESAAAGLLRQLLELDEFAKADKIALYLANDGEIDPRHVIQWCHDNSRQSFVPVVRQQDSKNSLLFAPITPSSKFTENKFGIAEPLVGAEELLHARQLDLVLLPLVGFDQQGNRIGMGGGFYDTTFEFLKQAEVRHPALVGIAHEIQKVSQINAESWDVPLTTVVTDLNIYALSR